MSKGEGNIVRRGAFGVALMILAMAFTPSARAEVVLLEQTSFISGSQSFVLPVLTTGPGTLSVQLTTLAWPERLSSLSFALTSATSVLHRFGEPGSFSFDMGTAGSFYAHVAGTAQGALNLGLYSLRITFQPLAAPVPLPASTWLLLAGLASLATLRRNRAGSLARKAEPAPAC